MHFLDAWRELSALDLFRLLAPIVLIGAATFLPGARVVRAAAIGVAALLPGLRELAAPPAWVMAWVALWLAIAWRGSGVGEEEPRPITRGRGALESGAVAFGVGLALLLLLAAAVARQDMAPEDTRRASWGILALGAGVLHLMLRRHLRRAAVAFGAMGLGLQMLHGAARGSQMPVGLPPEGSVWIGTALATLLVVRIAAVRERAAGSPWVHDAHDLHD